MSKIIAVPSETKGGIEDNISGHFGHCGIYTLVKISDDGTKEIILLNNIPHSEGGCLAPVSLLKDNGVDVIIAKGMGMRPLMHFNEMGIKAFYAGECVTVNDAVSAFEKNELPQFDTDYTCQKSH